MQRLPGLRVKGCFSLSWCERLAGGTALRIEGVPLKKQRLTRKQLLNFDVQKLKKKEEDEENGFYNLCFRWRAI